MAKKECPSCAMSIDRVATRCPICGYEFPRQKSYIKYVALVLLIIFAWPLIRLVMRFLAW